MNTAKKNLVIVESPAKAKTLEKYLGKDYRVIACMGHVRDLPPKKMGIDIKHGFTPEYQTIKGKDKAIKILKDEAKKSKAVFLAPDPDREGEAIAWHLDYYLSGIKPIKRIEFNEITKTAVLESLKNPREIDLNRVQAQQARRLLDRLVGYKLSPLLWKKIRRGLSAGRVQSVAVRLICEREREILAFKPQEYWSITANLSSREKDAPFAAHLALKDGVKIEISDKKSADAITADLDGAEYSVEKIEKKKQQKPPYPPFITSTLQQEAYRKLGFSAKKTMLVAQKLYEGIELKGEEAVGLITYMRTDSVRVAKVAQDEALTYIKDQYGGEYLPGSPRFYQSKKQAQDAHEAIRPTGVFRIPEKVKHSLTHDEFKLYDLIWKRFVASQMQNAIINLTAVDIKAVNYTFRATGSTIEFEGFMAVYLEGRDEDSAEERQDLLPLLKEDEVLQLLSLVPKQHFTEPPKRYSEATLVKVLEQKGIGRPSTYAPTISTIQDRGYIQREGRALKPTELGMITNEQLEKHFSTILDYAFTAKMEDELDEIVEGKVDWVKMLQEFWGPFENALKKADENMEKIKTETKTDEVCPQCGKPVVIRQGRFGEFMACSGYPECKYTKNLAENVAEESTEACEKCGKPMVLKRSRYGAFWACSGYPKCKNIKSIVKKTGVKCPTCKEGEIVERKSKKGRVFYGCSRYPKCEFSSWDIPYPTPCPVCQGLMVTKQRKDKTIVQCTNKECGHKIEEK